MKRFPAAAELDDMANCLILLSKIAATENDAVLHQSTATAAGDGRLFECKTCEKKFPSFQALGGHRASHNKPKLQQQAHNNHPLDSPPPAAKPNINKTHECAICGLEFAMGQALGGHMRRHRAALSLLPAVAIMKKSSSSPTAAAKSTGHGGKRVMCLDLDLNLTPVENYDLKLQLGSALQIA
ncbi:unnamed protein product [Linum trigynum]